MSHHSYYLIDLPSGPQSSDVCLVKVLPSSAEALRTHVERFARYFMREMHFNGLQFEASETQTSLGFVPYKAFLFARQGHYIGAGCFRYRDDQSTTCPWLFDWLWLHPYCRGQGHLTRVWPEFQNEFDQFRCAQPLSTSMKHFLAKVGWNEAL
jgi:hypothetical protein